MNYLLDTNACIALMSAPTNAVQTRFAQVFRKDGKFFTSSIVAFELWYGVFKSRRPEENTARCETFFAGPIEMLGFQNGDAKIAGRFPIEAHKFGTGSQSKGGHAALLYLEVYPR